MNSNLSRKAHREKLGLMVAAHPTTPGFDHALKTAEAALKNRFKVYLYCIDDAVFGLESTKLIDLQRAGLFLFGCSYAMEKRGLPRTNKVTFVGLTVLHDIILNTDRFIAFS